jgi:ankyrin repeat protein
LGRSRYKVVELLFGEGADINAQDGDYGNGLQAASVGGLDKIVKLLLSTGADVNLQGEDYGNALQAASYRCHDTFFGQVDY